MDHCDNESVLDMDTASLLEFNTENVANKHGLPTILGVTSTPLKRGKSPGPGTSSSPPPAEFLRCTTPKLQKIRKPKVLTPKHLATAASFIERKQEPARCKSFFIYLFLLYHIVIPINIFARV